MTGSYAVMNVSYLSALVLTTAANAIWLQATAPLWVFLFLLVGWKYRPLGTDWFLIACVAVGVGWILAFELPGAERVGVGLGLLSGMSYGGVLLCLRWLRGENAAWLIAVNQFVAMLAVLPLIMWRDAWLWPDARQLLILAAFGFVQMALPYLLVARGLRAISSLEASGISLLEPVLMPLWVLLVHSERPAQATVVGATWIFVGLAWKYGLELWRARTSGPGGTP
jgi:drug/metabolite transporter (DMT)-like permease